jgi:hypothetical protein
MSGAWRGGACTGEPVRDTVGSQCRVKNQRDVRLKSIGRRCRESFIIPAAHNTAALIVRAPLKFYAVPVANPGGSPHH